MIALQWEEVHDSVGGFVESLDTGCTMTTSHAIVAAFAKGIGPTTSEIYRSTDNGETWTKVADLKGTTTPGPHRMVNLPDDIVIYPVLDLSDNIIYLYRSDDAGLTWNVAQQYQGPAAPPFRDLFCNAGITYNQDSILWGGRFQSPSQGSFQNFIRSTDKGQTWNFAGTTEQPGGGPIPTTFTNAGRGRIVIAFNDMTVWWSNDYGASWTPSTPLTLPPGFFGGEAESLTSLTPDVIIYGCGGSASGNPNWPYLYRSINGGQTWAHVDASAIADWPASPCVPTIWEVKRLTKDMCIMLHDLAAPIGTNPTNGYCQISVDQGATWTVIPTGLAFPVTNRARSFGALVTADNGKLLTSSFNVQSGAHRRIWKGTLTC